MYAIVEIAGKQFRVAKDMKIKVPLLQGDAGAKVDFDRVYMVEDDKGNVTLGKPLVGNTSVSAEIVEHGRDKKIIVFKKKRRKGHQKKNGHRQGFSLIEITGIGAAKKAPAKKAAASKAPVKEKPAEKAVKAEAKPVKKTPAKAEAKTTAEAKPVKKAPAKKAAAPKATAKKKPAAKAAAAKKPAVKKAAKPAAGSAKKDVKED